VLQSVQGRSIVLTDLRSLQSLFPSLTWLCAHTADIPRQSTGNKADKNRIWIVHHFKATSPSGFGFPAYLITTTW
jgi:hypothetical protein